jgi:hypothetical protein
MKGNKLQKQRDRIYLFDEPRAIVLKTIFFISVQNMRNGNSEPYACNVFHGPWPKDILFTVHVVTSRPQQIVSDCTYINYCAQCTFYTM